MAYIAKAERSIAWGEGLEIKAKEGLPSADRNDKATLLLTGPFRSAKSSARDLTPRVLKLQFANYPHLYSKMKERPPTKIQGHSLFVSVCIVREQFVAFWHGF